MELSSLEEHKRLEQAPMGHHNKNNFAIELLTGCLWAGELAEQTASKLYDSMRETVGAVVRTLSES